MSIVAELKRRNVFRVAAAYAVVGWLLVEVSDTIFPRLGLPDWTVTFVIALVMLGFPIALFLSWAFELTPEGMKRTEVVDADDNLPHNSGRVLDVAIIAGLLLVAGVMIWQQTAAGRADPASQAALSAAAVPMVPPDLTVAIAVLPFVNMSGDADNEYFADGISEEILNLLAQDRGLRVAGRTSSFKFKGHNEDLRVIGEQLGVSHIVEGSVRKSGDRVRITAQLIQVEDGFHLWSDTWDRELIDIFAVQDEIGQAIVASLRGQLIESAPLHHVATTQLDAYTHYLRAQTLLAARGADNLRAAREQFEAALALDPAYVPALAGLARTLSLIPSYARSATDSPAALAEAAVAAARRVLALEPDNVLALSALGTAYTFYLWRWNEAEAAFSRALELAPNDAEVVNFAGDYYRATMNTAQAVAIERRAVELDPLHAVNHWDLAWAYLGSGDCKSAIIAAETARAITPDRLDPYLILNWCYGQLHRFDEQRRITGEARRRTRDSESYYLVMELRLAVAEGRREDALAMQETLRARVEAGEHQAANLGFHYLLLGESDQAAVWLRRAYDQREVDLVFPEPIDLQRFAADPGVRAVLARPGLKELVAIRARNANTASRDGRL